MDQLSPTRQIKQGRRSGSNVDELSVDDSSNTRNLTASPKPARKEGAWGDDAKKRSDTEDEQDVPSSKKKNIEDDIDERLRPDAAMIQLTDDTDDIPVIPDLDDVTEDDLAQQIAAPPSVQVTRVATYRELDNAFEKHAGLFAMENGIDLKLLARSLANEADVFENDRIWDWDRTFTEISSELQSSGTVIDEEP